MMGGEPGEVDPILTARVDHVFRDLDGHVQYVITCHRSSDGTAWRIKRRYHECRQLRERLIGYRMDRSKLLIPHRSRHWYSILDWLKSPTNADPTKMEVRRRGLDAWIQELTYEMNKLETVLIEPDSDDELIMTLLRQFFETDSEHPKADQLIPVYGYEMEQIGDAAWKKLTPTTLAAIMYIAEAKVLANLELEALSDSDSESDPD